MSVSYLPPATPFQSIAMLTGLILSLAICGCTTPAAPAQTTLRGNTAAKRVPEQLKPDLYPDGAKAAPEPVVRYGRYTLVSTEPKVDQRDLMSQIVDVNIPDSLNPSVKDSLNYVLKRSGYALCPGSGDINILYTRPLPASQYHLGPMTLRNTLQVLAGPAWQVEVDEITRGVCFSQRPGYQRVPPVQPVRPAPPIPAAPSATTFSVPVAAPISQGVR